MHSEITKSIKGFVTDVTFKSALIRVGKFVIFKLAGLSKCPATDVTHERLNASVNAPVSVKTRRLAKRHTTQVALVRTIARMYPFVLYNLARVAKRHVANVTRVRLLTGVNSFVHRVRRHRRKRFAAQVAQDVTSAGARPVTGMHKTQVLGEIAGETKRLVADITDIRPVTRMRAFMFS